MNEERSNALRRRIEALTASQRQSLAQAVAERNAATAGKLVAFIEVSGGSPPTEESLRAFMAARVPEYMIPARFVALDKLPRNAAGKVDRRALSAHAGIRGERDVRGSAAPRTDVERTLARIWREALKVDDVGIDDDFFELGGDSLLSIRVIARAGREGIRVAPEQFFNHPTIRQMASAVATSAEAVSVGPRVTTVESTGDAPLTPIQHWFLEAVGPRDWWNQSYLLEVQQPLDSTRLREIVGVLVDHHAALRLRLVQKDGAWRQEFTRESGEVPFRVISVADGSSDGYAARIVEDAEGEQSAMRLTSGNLFRCLLFEGKGEWRRLLLIAHHLLVDGVSWSILLEDLATLATQAIAGRPLALPARSSSAREWAMALAARAGAPRDPASVDYWLAMASREAVMPETLSKASAAGRVDVMANAELFSITLDETQTRSFLHDSAQRLGATPQAILLAALLIAWHESGGDDTLRLDLEGHGRDFPDVALDVSRTVGWFTTVFPAEFSLPRSTRGLETSPRAVVNAVQAALAAIPLRGAAHGLHRYLSPDASVRARLAAMPRRTMLFNFLGTHDIGLPPSSALAHCAEPIVRTRDHAAPRAYPLEVNSLVDNGRLRISIQYSRVVHDAEAIHAFAARMRHALDGITAAAGPRVGIAALDSATLSKVAELLGAEDRS